MNNLQNFRRLGAGLGIVTALEEITRHPEFWDLITVRQQYAGSAHADTDTIILRGPDTIDDLWNNLEAVNYPQLEQLPAVRELVLGTLNFLKARDVGRVMLVRLKAGGHISPHTDEGAYARYFARFHVPLESSLRCQFQAGEEVVNMAPGELWWFNHQVEHSVVNDGPARIHLIIDACAPGFTGALTKAPA